MTTEELMQLASRVVGGTQRRLPPEIRRLARDVPVHYQERPAEDVLREGFPADILGFFTGSERGAEASQPNPSPAQIVLYVANLWQFAEQDADVFREETRLTYLHELGHYLGWDEDEVAAHGLE